MKGFVKSVTKCFLKVTLARSRTWCSRKKQNKQQHQHLITKFPAPEVDQQINTTLTKLVVNLVTKKTKNTQNKEKQKTQLGFATNVSKISWLNFQKFAICQGIQAVWQFSVKSELEYALKILHKSEIASVISIHPILQLCRKSIDAMFHAYPCLWCKKETMSYYSVHNCDYPAQRSLEVGYYIVMESWHFTMHTVWIFCQDGKQTQDYLNCTYPCTYLQN